jgi:hypothetical protein
MPSRQKKEAVCVQCKRLMKICAGGKCHTCYYREYTKKHPRHPHTGKTDGNWYIIATRPDGDRYVVETSLSQERAERRRRRLQIEGVVLSVEKART